MPYYDYLRPPRRISKAFGVALLVVAALALMLAGCSSSKLKTHLNPEYNFSFQYPGNWRLLELEPDDLPEGVSSSAGAWDPRGSGNEADLALDFISVDVLEFGADAGVSAETLQEEFERWLADAGASDSSFAVAEDPTPVTIGGLDGYQATYTYGDGDTSVRCTEYWLLTGSVMYDLYTSASEDHWREHQAVFAAFLDSFKLGEQDQG
jgi:hypothetical protein